MKKNRRGMSTRRAAWALVAGMLFSSLVGQGAGSGQPSADWPYRDSAPTGRIGYIREEIPDVPVKACRGTRYEDWVPDTYDIAERARLAINVLTCGTDPGQDHEQYFIVYLGNPLRMAHCHSDWCHPKFMEALPLLRLVTGSDQYEQVDRVWMDVILKSLGPDGLFYYPIQGKPWYTKELQWSQGIAMADGTIFASTETPDEEFLESLDPYAAPNANPTIAKSGISQFSHPQPCGRVLNTMIIYYLRDPSPVWKGAIERMIDRLLELAVDKDDYCYFPALYFEPNARYDRNDPLAEMPTGTAGGEINGRCIKGPALFYKLTGYEPARRLAEKLTRFMRFHNEYYDPDGGFTRGGEEHFHVHTMSMLGMLEYATATSDRELLEFIRNSFEWAKSPESGGCSLTGYMPEHAEPESGHAEGCPVAEMIAWALKLSASGVGDYYEDAERWVRNQFAEMQLTPEKVNDFVRWGRTYEKKNLLYNETDDRVGERVIGSFAGWSSTREWLEPGENEGNNDTLIMHCCTGNGTRALYYVWKHILDEQDGELKINMLLNRASPGVDVYSCIPYEGKVILKMKRSCGRVLVHAPEWIPTDSDLITVEVDAESRPFRWSERYLDLGNVREGEQVILKFPISERIVKKRIGNRDYTLLIKGNTVVSVSPPGKYCPLYRREDYRKGYTPWRKVSRFVSDENIAY